VLGPPALDRGRLEVRRVLLRSGEPYAAPAGVRATSRS
jgi:hypothetical protein